KGSVSGLGRTIPIADVNRRQLVQTDAAVNPGNSGGPLLATDTGKVVGLVDLGTAQANGISFAVSAGVASPLLKAWQVAPQPTAESYCGNLAPNIGTPSTTSTASEEVSYARAVAHVLENSAAVRKQLVAAVSEASSNRSGAQQALALVIAARRDELDAARNAAVPSGAEETQAAFVRAFRLSLTSDLLYQQWIKAGSSTSLKRAQANDKLAVAAKSDFMTLYNNLRTEAGLPPFPANFPF
ncbi:MAG TPA: trypsin-like peptidase domain-containing protein, partial [Gaiellaceae bacterium]|nr:trypsin-like peptidase domain-containing protein [Gaiellaceae bacterium]